jgi:hypothetical protein
MPVDVDSFLVGRAVIASYLCVTDAARAVLVSCLARSAIL